MNVASLHSPLVRRSIEAINNVVREKNTEGTMVEIQATSTGGYSGPGTFHCTICEGRIARLEIR